MRCGGRRAAALAAVAAALPGPAAPAAAPRPIVVTMTEYAFQPNHLVFRRGVTYRLHFENRGREFHEFTAPKFLKAVRIANRDVVTREGDQVDMPPGAAKDLVFVAPRPGRYRFWCADHDWAGMTGEIAVE